LGTAEDRAGDGAGGWDEGFDVVVAGTGAAGMTAAIVARTRGLSVLLVEKTAHVGGTTAVSGGAVWVPNTTHRDEAGHADDVETALLYLDRIVGNLGSREMRRTFLERGPEAIAYVEANSALAFVGRKHSPDYFPDAEGASLGGRSMDPLPFDGRELGAHFAELRPPIPEFMAFGGMMVNRTDIDRLLAATRSAAAFGHAARLILRYARDRLSHPRGTRLLMGNALAGRLFRTVLDLGIPVWRSSPARGLVLEGGRVAGIAVEREGRTLRVRARRGVVLATGGFPGDAELRRKLMPEPTDLWSAAPETNQGDGIRIAESSGGTMAEGHSNAGFLAPVSVMRRKDGSLARFPHLMLDRPKPGLIAVNAAGRRFVNEAGSYHEFVKGMHASHASVPTVPAFLVCDHAFLRKYGLGLVLPGWYRRLGPFLESGYLVVGETPAALARKLGIDPAGLEETVRRHNGFARTGVDEDFGKGANAYNRYMGDAGHGPNPCLGPIETAPFYAVRVYPGDIGTGAGLRTDRDARVLDRDGKPIDGLYACGNDMASIMGGEYPGPGITLGPGITFGYVAAMHLARSGAEAGGEAAEEAGTPGTGPEPRRRATGT
jgi:succinate dehydrogenase/fumarate reductase flavoprotein subunit